MEAENPGRNPKEPKQNPEETVPPKEPGEPRRDQQNPKETGQNPMQAEPPKEQRKIRRRQHPEQNTMEPAPRETKQDPEVIGDTKV